MTGTALGINVRGVCFVTAFAVNIFMLGTGVIVEMAVVTECTIFRRGRRLPEGDVRVYERRITQRIMAFLANYIHP